jgi:hypothetical protein
LPNKRKKKGKEEGKDGSCVCNISKKEGKSCVCNISKNNFLALKKSQNQTG